MFGQVRPRRIKRLQCKNGHWVDPMRHILHLNDTIIFTVDNHTAYAFFWLVTW